MATHEPKFAPNSPIKTHNIFIGAQIFLRISTFVATLASAWIIITNKQTIEIGVFTMDAKYNYSPTSKFLAYANIIVCVLSLFSLFFLCFIGRYGWSPARFFFLFLHDMVMMSLILAGCSAATAIGYLGKYGNAHSGWMPVCDHFEKFCKRGTVSLALSYLAFAFLITLTVTSASKSRQILM
ncbi:CASP-like protein 1F2 [Euphorbia lathyris]|uniref:CASP-like protein 1F2 n=1 Tax=Euphorbia lathyris TaxID=212925 RepID=UPI003313FB6B